MKRNSPAAARRYARALFDVAVAGDQAAAVHTSLKAIAGLLRGSKELMAALQRPTVPAARKKALLRAVAGGNQDLTLRFLDILIDKGRVSDAPLVGEAFEALWNTHRNVAKAQVVSARELDDNEASALKAALEKLTGSGIELNPRVDPELIGGVVVRVAGRTYDGSVRSQIQALRTRLAGAD